MLGRSGSSHSTYCDCGIRYYVLITKPSGGHSLFCVLFHAMTVCAQSRRDCTSYTYTLRTLTGPALNYSAHLTIKMAALWCAALSTPLGLLGFSLVGIRGSPPAHWHVAQDVPVVCIRMPCGFLDSSATDVISLLNMQDSPFKRN